MKRKFILAFFVAFTLLFLTFIPKAEAATLTNLKDTITTSRPSASTPLVANQAANATQVTVYDNGSIFLASDSAVLKNDTGETLNTMTIASMSATAVPSAGQRVVYFTSTAANTHHNGDPIITAISATHSISFLNSSAIPVSGKIVFTFPALATNDANTPASPSASTFQFNGISSTKVKVVQNTTDITANFTSITFTNPSAGTSPTVTLTLDGSTSITGGSNVYIHLGCTAVTSAACTTASPLIINPTTNSVAAGTARTWQVNVETQDTNSVVLDSGKVKIATVDSVLVQATVDPSLTVTIAGLAGNANYNSSSGSCASEVSTCGIAATATTVNLGALGSGNINHCGQTITVSTNAADGYVITATSSGRFIDSATGNWLTDANGGSGLTANDTPVPAVLPTSGSPAFGISPCGARVPAAWTGGSALAFSGGGKLSNPWNSGTNMFYATIASYTSGPVASDVTVIRYAATVSTTTPAGLYKTYFTYVVTPVF